MMSPQAKLLLLAEATAKALRHRKWHWCRRENGFSDMPVWRLVAVKLDVPLTIVLAFVNRLEEHANAADPRGSVEGFNAAEFGAALDISAETAAQIFAALEHHDVGWIGYGHLATFQVRNPDREDDNATERKRRQRRRDRGMKQLARLFAAGEITEAQRLARETELLLDDRVAARLSTGHIVTPRDIVTVTPEQSKVLATSAVDNSAAAPGGESAGSAVENTLSDDAISTEAETWLSTEAVRIVVERMGVPTPRAQTLIERWRRDLNGDATTMVAIIAGADQAQLSAARFHVTVTDQVRRHIVTRELGTSLQLGPVAIGPAVVKAAPVLAAESPAAEVPLADELSQRRRASGE